MRTQVKKLINNLAGVTGYIFFAVVIAGIILRIIEKIVNILL